MAGHTASIVPSDPSLLSRSDRPFVVDLCCGTGAIARLLLGIAGPSWTIACVDASSGMLKEARAALKDPRCSFIRSDALSYLESLPEESVDALFCGWGLVYLDARRALRAIRRSLKPGGVAGFIMNAAGTLRGVERAVVTEMLARPFSFCKVLDLARRLPAGKRGLKRMFGAAGFETLDAGEGEEIASFSTEREFRSWLLGTGALAGVFQIFRGDGGREAGESAIARICSMSERDGRFRMNHRFAWGIFSKRGAKKCTQ